MRNKKLLLSVLILLAGCSTADKQIYIASDTTLGVNGAMNTAQTSGKLIVGYDRKFIAYVPKKDDSNGADVMSAFNCTHVEIKNIRITKFYEHIATGEAAEILAASLPDTGNGDCGYNH